MGERWPLTVEEGEIECRGGIALLFTPPGGPTYALNGTAQDLRYGIDVHPIWAPAHDADEAALGLKQNIGDLMERARALC